MVFDLNEVEKKKLIALFEQHEKNIDYVLYLRDIIWQKPVISGDLVKGEDQYKKRDYLFNELEKAHPFPNNFVSKNMKWDAQILRVDDFLANPYLNAIKNVTFDKDGWSLTHKKLDAYSLFPYQEQYHYGPNYNLKMGLGYFDKDYSYPSISLYGNEWMSLNPYEIRTMENAIITARGKVLTLGLGLGYYAYMVHLKEEVKEVHIVEMDLELIKVFNEYLLPLFPHPEKIHIHKADAFFFVGGINNNDYDFIFSDLWHDVSDGIPMYIKLKQSFNQLSKLQRYYWIEGDILTYFRMLVIGVMKDEFYNNETDYNDIQLMIKEKLKAYRISNNYDIDGLLSIKGLNKLILN